MATEIDARHWRTGTVDSELFDSLYSAVDKGPNKAVLEYLASGGDPDLRRKPFGFTLLHAAAFKGRRSLVEALIQAGADVDALSHQHFTPVATAAHKAHIGCVRVLLAAGASLACRPLGMSIVESLKHASDKSPDVERVLLAASAGKAGVAQ